MLSGDFGAIDAIGIGPGMPKTYGILPIANKKNHIEFNNSTDSRVIKPAYRRVDSSLML